MRLRDTGRRLAERLKSKVRIPFTARRISVIYLLIVGILIVAGAAVAGLRDRPLVCTSCHEMRVHLDSWSVSSHKDVTCDQCHDMPGWTWMAKVKLGAVKAGESPAAAGDPSRAHGHVRDESCKKCHPETRDVIVYHGLKITHKRHWDRNISCLVCHSRIVHGGRARTKNVPTMRMCFTCHDGKTAPNACGTCHETLGERRAKPFSPEWVEGHKQEVREQGRESCERCHDESSCENCHRMVTPHPSNWVQVHPARYKQDPDSCHMCHPRSEWAGFCNECHGVKRAHRLDWVSKHPEAVRRNPASCDRCHERSFCSDCHSRYRHHPADWLQLHPGQAKARPENCRTCHKEQFCIGCHQNRVPASHKSAAWGENHRHAVEDGGKACQTCHAQGFCMGCHRNKRPGSHSGDWLRAHGQQASASRAACSTCHTASSCQQCHGMDMPHPANWLAAHRPAAQQSRAVCERCHKPMYCAACHRGTRPSSHTATWISGHGAHARRSSASCLNCHTRELCTNCHRNTRPASHGANFLRLHGAKATSACNECHDKSSCDNCHRKGVARPASHTQTWLASHAKTAKVDRQGCAMCHDKKYCTSCHGTELPHPDGWAIGGHKKAASFRPDSMCFKCHEKKYCYQCHEER